jgi:putative DNA primase/helicase
MKYSDVSPYDRERAFLDWLEEIGIPPDNPGNVHADGRLRRYRVRGEPAGKKDGVYTLYPDGAPAGWAMHWNPKYGLQEGKNWLLQREDFDPLSDEERQALKEEAERRELERERQKKEERGSAARRAAWMWESSTPVGEGLFRKGQYLERKKLPRATGARQFGNDLIVPLFSPDGKITSVQTIAPDGRKTFLTGGRMKGCFLILGEEEADRARYVFVAEGWATAASIYECTGCTTVVAWNCGNLRPVIQTMIERWPGKLVLAADNDRKSDGNPGASTGFTLAEEFDIPLALPVFEAGEKGTDWNDYMVLHDVERTAEALFAAVEEWEKKAPLEYESRCPAWIHRSETKEGKIKPDGTMENAEVLLRKNRISLRYIEHSKKADMTIPGVKFHADGRSEAESAYVVSLCARYHLPLSEAKLDRYLNAIAMKNAVNPIREWILSKPWDGTDRVDQLFRTLTVREDFSKEFAFLLMRRWLLSAVGAIFERSEFRNRGVLVLQSEQSIGKTSWFARLVPSKLEAFTTAPSFDTRDKDSVKRVVSYWITELGELEGIFRIDLARLKSFLTMKTDELRLPYGRTFSKFARRTVFCASVNQSAFLIDRTGNSRWWVIPCVAIDYEHGLDMQQVWAQVYDLYRHGERWWLDREEERVLTASNWEFEQADEIEDLIRGALDWSNYEQDVEMGWVDWLSATDVLRLCRVEQVTQSQATRAGIFLSKLTGRPSKKINGQRCYQVPRKKG